MGGDRRLGRAHVALAAVFVVLGALGGTWDARLPALRQRLSLDSGELGLVIFAVLLAATAILPLAGWLTARRGSRGPSALGLLCAGAGITAAAFVPSYATLLPAAALIGAGWGIVDVASNAHGVAIERALGRRVLSRLHSAWSFGLLVGSRIAAGAAAASVGLSIQFPVVAAAAARDRTRGRDAIPPAGDRRRARRRALRPPARRTLAAGAAHVLRVLRRSRDRQLGGRVPHRPRRGALGLVGAAALVIVLLGPRLGSSS